jgi:hypothetical protein
MKLPNDLNRCIKMLTNQKNCMEEKKTQITKQE